MDEAMAAKDYGRAVELCREALAVEPKEERLGPLEAFAERLIEALDLAGDKDEAALELENLCVSSFSLDRFGALKKRYPDLGSWSEALDRIIATLGKSRDLQALAAIYEAEGMAERLLALAEKDESIFEEYLDTIGRSYPERSADFLEREIEAGLRRTASRNSYSRSAASILRYGTFAGAEAAEALFDSLLAAYPGRRAMREEFERARRKS